MAQGNGGGRLIAVIITHLLLTRDYIAKLIQDASGETFVALTTLGENKIVRLGLRAAERNAIP